MKFYSIIDACAYRYGDVNLIIKQLEVSGGPLLDLGCGTGRILEGPLANGIKCYGVELSDEMLQQARKRLDGYGADQLSLIKGDILVEKYPEVGTASIMLNTLALFTDREDRQKIFKKMFDAIRPGGTALVVQKNDNYSGFFERESKYETPLGVFDFYVSHNVNEDSRLDEMFMRISHNAEVEEHRFPLALISVVELTSDLENIGFTIDGLYGDFELGEYDRTASYWQVFLLSKERRKYDTKRDELK